MQASAEAASDLTHVYVAHSPTQAGNDERVTKAVSIKWSIFRLPKMRCSSGVSFEVKDKYCFKYGTIVLNLPFQLKLPI